MGLTIHYSLKSSTRSPKKARELVARLRGRALDLPFAKVEDIVELTGEACDFERCDRDDPHRWLLIQAGQYVGRPATGGRTYSYNVAPTHLIAFETLPGDGCESANFGLCRYPAQIEVADPDWPNYKKKMRTGLSGWSWQSFCKTQYASNPECGGVENFLRCHITLITLLDYVAKLPTMTVQINDEGRYGPAEYSDDWQESRAEGREPTYCQHPGEYDSEALAKQVGEWNEMIAAFSGRLKDQLDGGEMSLESAITEFPDFEYLEAKARRKE